MVEEKKRVIETVILFIISLILFFCDKYVFNIKDYTVIYGNVYTGIDGEKLSESVVLLDDKIVFVGDKEDTKEYINRKTKILDYSNDFIISGFTDTHTHVTPYFGVSEYDINLSNASSIEEYINIINEYILSHPDNEMYVGRGYDYALFKNGTPTKDILDGINTEKPIFIKSSDGHACWVNSKMIELIGVDKNTEEVIGGKIEKDKKGNLVGCFRDAAMDVYVKPFIKPYSIDQYKELILKAQNYYASLGYTAYIEVFVESDETNYNLYKAYEELDKENKLLLRVQGAWNLKNDEKYLENLNNIIKYKNESKGGMFELTDVKIFMDGVVETGTSYLSEPYENDKDNYGADRWPSEEDFNKLVNIIITANKNDMVVHFHAIGDAAITKTLDAIEEARKSYINGKIHNVITHLEIVNESDINRFKDLDVVVAANLSWGCIIEDNYTNVEVVHLGSERAENAYPYKSVLDAGTVVSSATDYPAGSVPSPFSSYFVAINRNASEDENMVRGNNQKMTKVEALKSLTYSGAYQMRQEKYRGTIEVGKTADIIVLDKNLIDYNDISILDTKVLMTMVNGKIIYIED